MHTRCDYGICTTVYTLKISRNVAMSPFFLNNFVFPCQDDSTCPICTVLMVQLNIDPYSFATALSFLAKGNDSGLL